MSLLGKDVEYVIRWFRDSCEGREDDVEPEDRRVRLIGTDGRICGYVSRTLGGRRNDGKVVKT
jgi:hypothetical protein